MTHLIFNISQSLTRLIFPKLKLENFWPSKPIGLSESFEDQDYNQETLAPLSFEEFALSLQEPVTLKPEVKSQTITMDDTFTGLKEGEQKSAFTRGSLCKRVEYEELQRFIEERTRDALDGKREYDFETYDVHYLDGEESRKKAEEDKFYVDYDYVTAAENHDENCNYGEEEEY